MSRTEDVYFFLKLSRENLKAADTIRPYLDAEQTVNLLENADNTDDVIKDIKGNEETEPVLLPPQDGNDCDKDDGASDNECIANIRGVRKGVLSEPAEIRVAANGE
ncbi:hypothetical protein ANN_19275, partial [Periplaneta americana]